MVGFTHSRNVISSNAKSFPQPPATLSLMTNIKVDVEAGVVKSARYCFHRGSWTRGRSPVIKPATVLPSGVSNRTFKLGNIKNGHFFVGLQRSLLFGSRTLPVPKSIVNRGG